MPTVQFLDVEIGSELTLAGGIFLVTGKKIDGDSCCLAGEYTTPDGAVFPQFFYGLVSSEVELTS
ncbi:hypothetical protein [Klebsiella quasipneumoniae]|uniref:hypothetical protein n=1 Tax=Klebsiella quasipneumoniae TaxID=1463165 RepID=UPI003DA02F58